jgi:hypothetical protein
MALDQMVRIGRNHPHDDGCLGLDVAPSLQDGRLAALLEEVRRCLL